MVIQTIPHKTEHERIDEHLDDPYNMNGPFGFQLELVNIKF